MVDAGDTDSPIPVADSVRCCRYVKPIDGVGTYTNLIIHDNKRVSSRGFAHDLEVLGATAKIIAASEDTVAREDPQVRGLELQPLSRAGAGGRCGVRDSARVRTTCAVLVVIAIVCPDVVAVGSVTFASEHVVRRFERQLIRGRDCVRPWGVAR